MPRLKFYLLVFLGAFTLKSNAQNNTIFKHISPMIDNRKLFVSSTSQDAFGNILMVNSGHLILYNGYEYRFINKELIFKNININDGLKSITYDNNSNNWLLSHQGRVSLYNSSNDCFINISDQLQANDVIVDIVVKGNTTWLCSSEGIIYQYLNNKIIPFQHKAYLPDLVTNFDILNKQFFFSTKNGKILLYNPENNLTEEIVGTFSNYPEHLILLIDNHQKLWIGTETFGLFVYDINKKQFIQDSFYKGNISQINKEIFINLFYSSDDFIYGSTDGGGLYKINAITGDVEVYKRQLSNEFSITNNTIFNVSEDKHKNLWIATKGGIVNILPKTNPEISYYSGSEDNVPLRVLSIYKSLDNTLWIGSDGSGLTKISYNANGTIEKKQYFKSTDDTKGFYIQSITEDDKFKIWFGTYRNGLWIYDRAKDKFKKIDIYNSDKQQATDIRTVYKDSKKRIWVASNTALNVYDSKENLLASFERHSSGLKGYTVESIMEDNHGNLWFGIYEHGLYQFKENLSDLNSSKFINYPFENIPKNIVNTAKNLCQSDTNELWLTNGNNEVLKFNTLTKQFQKITAFKNYNGKSIAGVINSGSQNFWFSSNDGIIHLNLKNNSTEAYYSTDGLQDNMFLSRSAYKDHNGIVYFGGVKGLNYFDPNKISKTESQAKLYINNIKILNKTYDKTSDLQKANNFNTIDTLYLNNNQSSFSFKFHAIDNLLNPKYYYAYRLKGFDKEWVSSPERIANYTNIPAGKYTFEVKAGTKKNVWDIPPKTIQIFIAQPYYNTPFAYFIYSVFIGLCFYGINRWNGMRKKLFLEGVRHKKEREINEAKMTFFAKMSHEIQTPITLILGPIEDMLSKAEQNGNLLLKQRLDIISHNAHRLSKIAKILTLVKNKELNKLRLMVTKNDLFEDINNITLSFKELARKKQIDFIINCPKNLPKAWYDKEKLEHILYNLLSNAFKFTPKEENIQLTLLPTNHKRKIKISIIDSGPGIPKDELEDIFKLFYQSKIGKKNDGSGIGLALTKDLIDLHKASIEVYSKASQGTAFIVTIPISEDAYDENERIISENTDSANLNLQLDDQIEKPIQNSSGHKKTVLIVEDNYDLQTFLKELLAEKYNLLLAENGEEGFIYAKNNYPDLILSDIMMPKLDGIEMCEKLQNNQLTKHIPIILLTAKNSTKSKLLGLQSGAIEYINKPFNTNELLLKINNIISSKEHIISKYRNEALSVPQIKEAKSNNEVFLENMISQINDRLADSNFKMEELADSLNVSYSSLYRKCIALTGHSIVDFVKLIRLKKGAILIAKYGYTISETAYMVGFNNPKYFSENFKKQFKKTPKDFKNKALKSGNINAFLVENNIDINSFIDS